MKKIIFAFAIASAALALTSCGETWDDNPKLEGHEGTVYAEFLNSPVMADNAISITEAMKNGTLNMTCSQPYYGYAAVVTYRVQVSLTPDFSDYTVKENGDVVNEINMDFFDCAQINPTLADVASKVETLMGVKNESELPTPEQPVYFRLRAFIAQSPDNTQYLSNVVSYNSISCEYLAIWVAGQPVNYYLRGGMNDWGADAGSVWQFMTGEEENTWNTPVVTIEAGTEFKVADAAWGPFNAGWGGDSGDVYPDKPYTLNVGDNPGNLTMKEDFTGQAFMRLEKGEYILTLDTTKGAPEE